MRQSEVSHRNVQPSLKWLLVFIPASLIVQYVSALHNEVAIFVLSGLAIIPLAGLIGEATEALARHVGQGIGGLLNATFGNAAELIITLMALSKGLIDVVKASLTGSIIGNMLLVCGLSAFVGGLKRDQQRFNAAAVRASATTLMLAALALLIPTVFHRVAEHRPEGGARPDELHLSIFLGVVLIMAYVALLFFSLKTHRSLFTGSGNDPQLQENTWSKKEAILILITATAAVAWMSELLVGSIESARHSLGLTEIFVGVIVIATIGNAAEHTSAVLAAMKDKMDLALGIAIGSSLQIALFVAPFCMFCSYLLGHPMTLEFTLPEVVAVVASVLIVAQISGDGESNWLEGALLLAVYAIIGALFFFLPPTH